MKTILVTGGSGQVGQALARIAWPPGWQVAALTRAELELSDPRAIAAKVAERGWAAVINAAAYTAVDRAETETAAAWAVNALAPAALAAACRKADVPLVHISTDYVFDGTKAGDWEIDDPVGPLGVYGASKLGGELAVRASGARHAIIRSSWVISPYGTNFAKTMVRLAAERDSVRVVADQRGSPTSAADLARVLGSVAMAMADDRQAPSGVFHFANAGGTTWAGLAEAIFAGIAVRGGTAPAVIPIATADYPTAARRPANSLLSTRRLAADYGIAPRPWRIALAEVLDTVLGPLPT